MARALNTWWLWRLKPGPKRRLFDDLQLPASYLHEDRFDPEEIVPGTRVTGASMKHEFRPALADNRPTLFALLERLELELGQRGIQSDGFVRDQSFGAMRTMRLELVKLPYSGSAVGRQHSTRYVYWLTPPVEQFADLKRHFDEAVLREALGPLDRERRYQYFANREVVERAGEYIVGSFTATHSVAQVEHLQLVVGGHTALHSYDPARGWPGGDVEPDANEQDIANFLLVALDSFLEARGGGPDPRFNPRFNPR